MSGADRNDTTLLGPKMADTWCRPGNMSPTCRPTRHCRLKIADTDIRHAQLRREMVNGMQVKSHNCISIELRRQSKDLPVLALTLTSTNVETWLYITSKPWENLMRQSESGKTDQQARRRGRTSKCSYQQNMQKKINRTNLRQRTSRQKAEATEELIAALTEKHS